MVTDSHSILAGWRNHFSQLLNVRGLNDDKQADIHTAEPLVPVPSAVEFELAIDKIKTHNHHLLIKSQQKLLKQRVQQFTLRTINLLILFGISRNCLRSGRIPSLYLFIQGVMKQILVIIEAYHFCQLHTKFYPTHPVKVDSICRRNYWGSSVWNLMQQFNH